VKERETGMGGKKDKNVMIEEIEGREMERKMEKHKHCIRLSLLMYRIAASSPPTETPLRR
jgi:hypothetical protein